MGPGGGMRPKKSGLNRDAGLVYGAARIDRIGVERVMT